MVRTKKIIKDAFWELLEKKPYNKITVQDIVNRCSVNRNTFYYYFQDIPTLMIDSIEEWIDEVIQKYGTITSPVDCLEYMAEECMKRKKAFLNLFHSAQKDAFLYALNKMGYDIINTYVDKIGENRKIQKQEKESFISCCFPVFCIFITLGTEMFSTFRCDKPSSLVSEEPPTASCYEYLNLNSG